MKYFFTILLLTGLTFRLSAQSNLILFTEQGEKFTVILNGLRINETAVTNLRVTDLPAPNYKLKVIFDNKAFGEMDKNLFLSPGNEVSYSVKKNNKGEYVLRPVSEVPLATAPVPPQSQTVYVFGNSAPVSGRVASTTTTTQQTTQTTNTGVSGNGAGVNMSVNDGMGGNVNINMNVGGTGISGGGSSTTTTTTTNSVSGTQTQYQQPTEVVTVGCVPMTNTSFESAKTSIKSKSFSDSKMTMAKQIIDKNCMSSSQIKGVMGLFDFEADKLTWAKYAWHKCTDTNNYFQINDGFDFEASIEELDSYLRMNPR